MSNDELSVYELTDVLTVVVNHYLDAADAFIEAQCPKVHGTNLKAVRCLNDKWARATKKHTSWKLRVKADKPWGNRLNKREIIYA